MGCTVQCLRLMSEEEGEGCRLLCSVKVSAVWIGRYGRRQGKQREQVLGQGQQCWLCDAVPATDI